MNSSAFGLTCIKYMQKALLELREHLYIRSKFSCVRSSHDLCARAHAHSLEGTLLLKPFITRSASQKHIQTQNNLEETMLKIQLKYTFFTKEIFAATGCFGSDRSRQERLLRASCSAVNIAVYASRGFDLSRCFIIKLQECRLDRIEIQKII